jgi:hypothetical protein
MKLKQIQTLTILFVSLLVFTACSKKDRDPQLVVTVTDASGTPLAGASVHVWPTDKLKDDSTNSGVLNEHMNQVVVSEANGEADFYFHFSAVLDVDVTYIYTTDSATIDTLEGHKVVKIETIKQKDVENFFYETVVVK